MPPRTPAKLKADIDEERKEAPTSSSPLQRASSMAHRNLRAPLLRTISSPSPIPLLTPIRSHSDSTTGDDEPLSSRSQQRKRKAPAAQLSSLLHTALLPANHFVQQRTGAILSRSMILKSDHFTPLPSSSSDALTAQLDLHLLGAPNLQQIKPFLLFGVGQPTLSGIRTVLNLIKAKAPHRRAVQWICLREEPIVYINNRPFVLRELDAPFHNLSDLAGISSRRIDAIEQRLKADILAEAGEHDGNVLVHDEVVHDEVRACWESADDTTVRTTREVFEQLHREGYHVTMVRQPITAESVMDAKQIDGIVRALIEDTAETGKAGAERMFAPLASPGNKRAFSPPPASPSAFSSPFSPTAASTHSAVNAVQFASSTDWLHIHTFNCQLGRGRSTLGMIIAYMLNCHALQLSAQQLATHSSSSGSTPPHESSNRDGLNALRRGEWDVVMKLVRLLKNGKQAKAMSDAAVDACGRVHHIRLAIVSAFQRSEHARGDSEYKRMVRSTEAALKRYFYLICFASYLLDLPNALTPAYMAAHSFQHFLRLHPELNKLANTLIEETTLHDITAGAGSGSASGAAEAEEGAECDPMDTQVFERSGAVLGRRTIIKSEYWTPSGADGGDGRLHHYRHVPQMPLTATAQPNVAGIRRILSELCGEGETHAQGGSNSSVRFNMWTDSTVALSPRSSSPIPQSASPSIVWINLREEPVLYLNAEPFLLRDYLHPFRILSEFTTGMTPSRCEQIEERFKADVLSELQHSASGQLLIHDETVYQQIKARQLAIHASSDVQTTAEVYRAIQNEGQYRLQYYRIPMHVEEVVGMVSFDRLFSVLSAPELLNAPDGVHVVFHDQKGGRRTTMGLIITFLIMLSQGLVDLQGTQAGEALAPLAEVEEAEDEESRTQEAVLQPSRDAAHDSVPTTEAASVSSAAAPSRFAPPVDQSQQPADFNLAPLKRAASVVDLKESSRQLELSANGRGEYKGILSLIRILKRGRQVKEEVDAAIDLCGSEYNVRDAIASALKQYEMDRTGDSSKGQLMQAVKHAMSYALLIIFNAYLHERRDREEDHTRERLHKQKQSWGQSPARTVDEEKQAEQEARREAKAHLEKDENIDASQLIDYNLFNPYTREGRSTDSAMDATRDLAEIDDTMGEEVAEQQDRDSTAASQRNNHSRSSTSASPDSTPRRADKRRDDSASILKAIDTPELVTPAASPSHAVATFAFPSFSHWLHDRPELRLALEFLHHEAHDALKLNTTRISEEFAAAFDRRNGNVLVRGSLLKSDYFAGVVNKNVRQLLDGAINFRPIDGFPVAGTGIPRAEGIEAVLHFFSAADADARKQAQQVEGADGELKPVVPVFRATSLLWLNLREEPILYVNHRPFVLRDGDNPYSNIENTGITPRRVEAMEKQLKLDAWHEVRQGGEGQLLVHDEDSNGNLICFWEKVGEDGLRTPREQFYAVFEHVEGEWKRAQPSYDFTARYYRTPITDEQAPSPAALDAMIRYLEEGTKEERRALMMNCQMGRGRTTTGLIIACLWCLHRGVMDHSTFQLMVDQQHRATAAVSTAASHGTHGSSEQLAVPGVTPALASSLRAGWFKLIVSLVRVLPAGQQVKAEVDAVCDLCGAMQNLRSVVFELQQQTLTCLPKKRPFFARRGTNYLVRYAFLILIAAYIRDEVRGAGEDKRKPFVVWLNERAEIMSLLKKVTFPQLE